MLIFNRFFSLESSFIILYGECHFHLTILARNGLTIRVILYVDSPTLNYSVKFNIFSVYL
jgi:hypothetical protein